MLAAAATGAPRRDRCTARLAEGTELLGPYQGSGSTEVPYLVRSGDGRVLQVPPLVYAVAAHADGRRGLNDLAALASRDLGRPVTSDNVAFVLGEKLGPAGLLHDVPAAQPRPPDQPGVLSLSLRTKVIPERWVGVAAAVLQPLFWPPLVLATLAAVLVASAWLYLDHGLGPAVAETIATPALLLVVGGLTVLSGAFHELGHATASRYGGARPGIIGVGLYLVWPAFFNDLTDSYRLSRRSRLRADLGGVYFNGVFILLLAGAYAWTGFEPLLVALAVQHVVVFHQFLPFLRLDGYYIVSDLAGVPDLFARIRPFLTGLVPGRDPSTALSDLRPAVRRIVAAWVVLTVPALVGGLVVLAVRMPVAVALGRDAFTMHAERFAASWQAGDLPGVAVSALQVAVLLLPVLGVTVTVARLLAWVGRRSRRPRRGKSPRASRSAAGRPGTVADVEEGAPAPTGEMTMDEYFRVSQADKRSLQLRSLHVLEGCVLDDVDELLRVLEAPPHDVRVLYAALAQTAAAALQMTSDEPTEVLDLLRSAIAET